MKNIYLNFHKSNSNNRKVFLNLNLYDIKEYCYISPAHKLCFILIFQY
jgi:hypothetical protein